MKFASPANANCGLKGEESKMKSVSNLTAKVVWAMLILGLAGGLAPASRAQDQSQQASAPNPEAAGTSTDLFVMLGSDFDRPGWTTKANYNIGIGHTLAS